MTLRQSQAPVDWTAAAARAAGFPDERVSDIEIVVSELASNLVKHAGGGDLVVRTMVGNDAAGLQVVTIDSGPGCRDIEALVRDGVRPAARWVSVSEPPAAWRAAWSCTRYPPAAPSSTPCS